MENDTDDFLSASEGESSPVESVNDKGQVNETPMKNQETGQEKEQEKGQKKEQENGQEKVTSTNDNFKNIVTSSPNSGELEATSSINSNSSTGKKLREKKRTGGSTSSKEQPQQEVVDMSGLAESTTAWFNWGSSFVKSIGDNLIDSMDKIMDIKEGGQGEEVEKGVEDKKISPSSESTTNNKIDVKNDFSLLGTFDKTLDFASDAIGAAVFTGLKSLEEAKLKEKAGIIMDIVKKDVEDSKVLDKGIKVGSGALSALERLGQRTVNVISETAHLNLSKGNINSSSSIDSKTPRIREITLTNALEDGAATAHFQALQMLSAESSLKIQGFESSSKSKEIETILDFDGILEGVSEEDLESENVSSFIGTEVGLAETIASLKSIGWERDLEVKDISKLIDETPKELETLLDEFEVVALDAQEGEDVSGATFKGLMKSLQSYNIKKICTFVERSSGLLLRFAEVFVLDGGNGTCTAKDALEKSKSLAIFIGILIKELQVLSHLLELREVPFKTKINVLKMTAQDYDYKWGNEGEDESKIIKEYLSKHDSSLSDDIHTATTFIQECVECLMPILKVLTLITASK